MPYNQTTLQEDARRELTRALALTIAYKAAVDDEARKAVVTEIGVAVENALAEVKKLGFPTPSDEDAAKMQRLAGFLERWGVES